MLVRCRVAGGSEVELHTGCRGDPGQRRHRRLASPVLVGAHDGPIESAAARELGLAEATDRPNSRDQLGCDLVIVGGHAKSVAYPPHSSHFPWRIRHSTRSPPCYPIATIRSIGTRARSAISGGTRTSNFISSSASRSLRS